MFARLLVAILLFSLLLIAPPSKMSSADDLQFFEDRLTGAAIVIPRALIGREKRTQFGLNWHGENLNIDTLAFPAERPMRSIYDSIKKRSGRTITRDEYSEIGFIIEGIDRDGMHFIVRVRDDGSKRGVSVVYPSRGDQRAQRTARQVADSFQMDGAILDPEIPTEAYLRQARELLSKVARNPGKAKELWPDFGAVTRKYRLRVGQAAATQAIQALLKEYPGSPLRSAAWGMLPLGAIADIKQQTYSTLSIYGPKTEHPNIRQELVGFLTSHPDDPYAFAAYYAIGAFEEAIASAERGAIPTGMLHYAAGHKKLSAVLQRTTPHLEKVVVSARAPQQGEKKECPVDAARLHCFFYETYGVLIDDRLGTFVNRAAKTDAVKVRQALESNLGDVRSVIEHLERAAKLSSGLPHEDDANYYLGIILKYLDRRSDALGRFEKAFSTKGGEFTRDYAYAARRQIIRLLLEMSEDQRVVVANSMGLSDPAVWYVLARDTYRRHEYATTIRIAETGLERAGVEIWRVPVTTESARIEDELRRLSRKRSDQFIDIHLVELIYLLNASREMERFVRSLQDQATKMEPKQVRSIILKYSLLTVKGQEEDKLHSGRLGQHRDLRQAIHLIGQALNAIPPSATPERDRLREWLLYRKVRLLRQFDPKAVELAVTALEQAYPRSDLLDDAYAELLYTQAFALKSSDAVVSGTFRLIAQRFDRNANALDNAYNWYAVYLRCKKDYQGARSIDADIVRRFPLTRHAVNAGARMVRSPQGCEMWDQT